MMHKDLVIGKEYEVNVSDCCLEIDFKATLVSKGDDSEYTKETVWSNGVVVDASVELVIDDE